MTIGGESQDPEAGGVERLWVTAVNERRLDAIGPRLHPRVVVHFIRLAGLRHEYVTPGGVATLLTDIANRWPDLRLRVIESEVLRDDAVAAFGSVALGGIAVPCSTVLRTVDGLLRDVESYCSDRTTMANVGHL